jgi:LacI family transcriptional regulator
LDYAPLEAARSLRHKRTRTIGLILPDTTNPSYSILVKGVEDTVFAQGWSLLLCLSGYEATREQAYAEIMISKQVDGVLYVLSTTDTSPVARLYKRQIPIVAIDREVPGFKLDCVLADNFNGSAAAIHYLLKLGHRHIGLIVRYSSLSNITERIRGYEWALSQAGIEKNPALVIAGGFGFEEGQRAIKELLRLDPRPTAVLASPDVVAIGAIRGAIDAGLQVPGHISVVGFDDIPVSSSISPSLTTVALPIWEMGRMAAEMLLKRIQAQEEEWSPERIVLPAHLVIRESTGAVTEAHSLLAGGDE